MNIPHKNPRIGTVTYHVIGHINPMESQKIVAKMLSIKPCIQPPSGYDTVRTLSHAAMQRQELLSQFKCGALSVISVRFSKWLREHLLNTPLSVFSMPDNVKWYASFFRPLAQSETFTSKKVFFNTSLVIGLYLTSIPRAIFRAIIAVVIKSFQRKTWRWISHIGVEIFKLLPTLAYSYASTAIIAVCKAIAIEASIKHCHPSVVNGCCCHPMLKVPLGICTQASARFRVTIANAATQNSSFFAARTSTKPFGIGLSWLVLNSFYESKSRKNISRTKYSTFSPFHKLIIHEKC